MNQLTVKQLGTLIACIQCGKQTYDRTRLPKGFSQLPKGFTNGNARRFVTISGVRRLVCEMCRYGVFGMY